MTVLGRAGCLSSLILGFGAALAAGCGGDSSPPPAPAPQPLVILHTNDLHSHLMGQSPEVDYTPATSGDDQTTGGVARLATAIGAARAAATAAGAPSLLLDAGDFMMGTPIELISTPAAAALTMMKALGYGAAKGAQAGDPAMLTVLHYTLQPMYDTVPGDPTTQAAVEQYITGIDTALGGTGLTYRLPVVETAVDLAMPLFAEAPVGNLVADAYRAVAGALQPSQPPVMGFEANGQIRSDIRKGATGLQWFADLFRVLPDGIGPNQQPGFPLVTYYLNAQDIMSGLQFDAARDLVSNDFFLQVSGLSITYD